MLTPLLATPPMVTTTLPVLAPPAIFTTIIATTHLYAVSLHDALPILLVPCVAPKLTPVIVTDVPRTPDVGLDRVRLGGGTVHATLTPALATPPTMKTTFPVVAPLGPGATMFMTAQLVALAAAPLNPIV